jgi:hypothetical protein
MWSDHPLTGDAGEGHPTVTGCPSSTGVQLLTEPAMRPPMNHRPSSTETSSVGTDVMSAPAIEAAESGL